MAKNRIYKMIKSGSVIFGIYLLFDLLNIGHYHHLIQSVNSIHLQNENSAEDVDQLGELFVQRRLKHHSHLNHTKSIPLESNINLYNLSTSVPLDTDAFECVQSATTPQFSICIYEPQIDKFISNYLKNGGIWEPSITGMFSKALDLYPNSVTVDIGANIGYYSFLSCVKNHEVIAIEPVYDSLVRFHQGAIINHCQNQISLLQNALYNEHSEVTMTTSRNNQGGIWINQMKDGHASDTSSRGVKHKIIKTTTLNDLLSIRPLSQAIVKIDIEGFECKVFEEGSRFLELVHVPYIFMEWHKLYINRAHPHSPCPAEAIHAMIDSLLTLGYAAFELHTGFKLDLTHRDGGIWRIDDTYWQHYSAPDLKPPY